jgi:hypothetical protein
MKNVRNVAIVLALAAAVVLVPGGGIATSVIGVLLSLAFMAGMAWFAARLYLEHRMTLFALSDRLRAILYGAIAAAVMAVVAAPRLFDAGGVGIVIWFAVMGGACYALFAVWRASREY